MMQYLISALIAALLLGGLAPTQAAVMPTERALYINH